jgi:hypothetical protein
VGKILAFIAVAVPSFFLGTLSCLYTGIATCSQKSHIDGGVTMQAIQTTDAIDNNQLQAKVAERVRTLEIEMQAQQKTAVDALVDERMQVFQQQLAVNCAPASEKVGTLLPSDRVGHFAAAMARTSKEDFTSKLELGVPLDTIQNGTQDVLIIYSQDKSRPPASMEAGSDVIPSLQVDDALKNCQYVNVLLTHHSPDRSQCIAIVPQYESYHLQKWMRVDTTGKLDKTLPLQMVSRGHQSNGRDQFKPPELSDTRKNWDMLAGYLQSIDAVLAELKPILEGIAVKNTVIVMVCNFGQAELLMNFVCSAKARGHDISNILVFATDQETTDLAESIGLTAYFDKRVRTIQYAAMLCDDNRYN